MWPQVSCRRCESVVAEDEPDQAYTWTVWRVGSRPTNNMVTLHNEVWTARWYMHIRVQSGDGNVERSTCLWVINRLGQTVSQC